MDAPLSSLWLLSLSLMFLIELSLQLNLISFHLKLPELCLVSCRASVWTLTEASEQISFKTRVFKAAVCQETHILFMSLQPGSVCVLRAGCVT